MALTRSQPCRPYPLESIPGGALAVTVRPEWDGATLQAFWRSGLGLSLRLFRHFKRGGAVLRRSGEGEWERLRAPDRLRAGDRLRLLPPPEESRVEPEPLPLQVVWEDAHLLLLAKPAGQVVHPTHGVGGGTLANAVAARLAGACGARGVHPVHRLDRLTSGLVLFARSQLAHDRLTGPGGCGLDRFYLAVVERGEGRADVPRCVEAPLAREPGRARRIVAAGGRPARTRFRLLRAGEGWALLLARPETGRTHQIRAHLAWSGLPVLGDALYGARTPWPGGPEEGIALHAWQLAFRHPVDGRPLRFRLPPPAAWRPWLEASGAPGRRILGEPA
ncbi:MAG: RluA family pseudouridine synthase [Bacillota bacterium]|nr:RluA family pseudouridine synthase [Bacillota bacterium]